MLLARRLTALVTALAVTAATLLCLCKTATVVAATAGASKHCCKSQPATPAPPVEHPSRHDVCVHCNGLSLTAAPVQEQIDPADAAPIFQIPLLPSLRSDALGAPFEFAGQILLLAPPKSLLERHCALIL